MNIKQNKSARAVSENRVVRDVVFVKNVGKRVKELVAEGHGLFQPIGDKKAIRHIIEEELGVCRQAVYVAFRALDLVSDEDRLFLQHKAELKKDLAEYGIGLANNVATSSGAMSDAGVFKALCAKHGVSMSTMYGWVAAINFAAELERDKRTVAKTAKRKCTTATASNDEEAAPDILDNTNEHGDESDAPNANNRIPKAKKIGKARKFKKAVDADVPDIDAIPSVTEPGKRKHTKRVRIEHGEGVLTNLLNQTPSDVAVPDFDIVVAPVFPVKRKYVKHVKETTAVVPEAAPVTSSAPIPARDVSIGLNPISAFAQFHQAQPQEFSSLVNFSVSLSAITAGFRAGDYQIKVESIDGLGGQSSRTVVIDAARFVHINTNNCIDSIISALTASI